MRKSEDEMSFEEYKRKSFRGLFGIFGGLAVFMNVLAFLKGDTSFGSFMVFFALMFAIYCVSDYFSFVDAHNKFNPLRNNNFNPYDRKKDEISYVEFKRKILRIAFATIIALMVIGIVSGFIKEDASSGWFWSLFVYLIACYSIADYISFLCAAAKFKPKGKQNSDPGGDNQTRENF